MRFSEIKKQLSEFTVGIAGAGGLGSNCAVALARTGIGRLVIADYDIVEAGNLNRQYFFTRQVGMQKTEALKENIRDINPDTIVNTHDTRLNKDNIPVIFGECDIIVEAFDRAEMKEMLAETVISIWPERPLVMGSGLAGFGDNNKLRERRPGSRLVICGDEQTEVSEDLPPLAPRVAIVANMQANVVVELLLKGKDA